MNGQDHRNKLTDKEYERTFNPMYDLRDCWGISLLTAQEFLEAVGYYGDPEDPEVVKSARKESNNES